jgi:uncharacterized protein (DUF1778 family)
VNPIDILVTTVYTHIPMFTKVIQMRCHKAQRALMCRAAKLTGLPLTTWLRITAVANARLTLIGYENKKDTPHERKRP